MRVNEGILEYPFTRSKEDRKPREGLNFPEESKGPLSVSAEGADARLQLKNISQRLPLKLSQINTPNGCLGNSHRNVN